MDLSGKKIAILATKRQAFTSMSSLDYLTGQQEGMHGKVQPTLEA